MPGDQVDAIARVAVLVLRTRAVDLAGIVHARLPGRDRRRRAADHRIGMLLADDQRNRAGLPGDRLEVLRRSRTPAARCRPRTSRAPRPVSPCVSTTAPTRSARPRPRPGARTPSPRTATPRSVAGPVLLDDGDAGVALPHDRMNDGEVRARDRLVDGAELRRHRRVKRLAVDVVRIRPAASRVERADRLHQRRQRQLRIGRVDRPARRPRAQRQLEVVRPTAW